MVQVKGARSGLSLRKAAHGEATFHARPHCVIESVSCPAALKPEKPLGHWVGACGARVRGQTASD